MRGGLDDALDKLARRDELRRRAAGEATGTPPAVQELVETIAAVVGRNPRLEVTVGVEGAGEPTLLHFFVEEGTVQVTVDPSLASRVTEATQAPKRADFDLDIDPDGPVGPPATHAYPSPAGTGEQTRRIDYDDSDRYDPGTGYGTTPYAEPDPYTRPVSNGYERPAASGYEAPAAGGYERSDTNGYHRPGNNGDDGQRRHAGPTGDTWESAFPTADTAAPDPSLNPFAVPPPPVPPQTARRIRPEQHHAPEEPSAAERRHGRRDSTAEPAPEQRGMPRPLPEPIPLKVDSEETEMAARRLAALLRDNPTLLRRASPE